MARLLTQVLSRELRVHIIGNNRAPILDSSNKVHIIGSNRPLVREPSRVV